MTKNKIKPRNPFRNRVPIEKALSYKPGKPETSSGVPFLDEVIEAIEAVGKFTLQEVAYYLALDTHVLSAGLELYTGKNFSEFKREYYIHKMREWKAENPKLTYTQMAKRLGFADYTGIWNVLNPQSHARYRAEQRQNRGKF